ncbi:MAG TPA: hypothetical protein VGQ52_06895 [Gemmatimonadaceae bacterium]|nr:hypothetical protein [Gemmatimonadaceae bacterium]
MHTRLHGSWTGTLRSSGGVFSGLDMSVTHDSLRKMMLTMRTDRPPQAGVASDFVMNGDKLHWT